MKVTPEIKKYIYDNNTLSSRALASLIESKFNIKIGHVTIDGHLQKARADAQANNSAKVEAVRSAVLDDAQRYAGKYLDILDKDIDAWKKLLKSGTQTFPDGRTIRIENVKDRHAASQAIHKSISTVIEFAKPTPEGKETRFMWLKDVPDD
jgi:hypothetical protein